MPDISLASIETSESRCYFVPSGIYSLELERKLAALCQARSAVTYAWILAMSDYHRYFVPGGTYFFTLVTERRAKLFAEPTARRLLGNVMRDCLARFPVEVVAIVLLPEHCHTIWALPPGDDRYSLRWRWIKREFTRGWLAMGGEEQARSASRLQERRRGIWQRRF